MSLGNQCLEYCVLITNYAILLEELLSGLIDMTMSTLSCLVHPVQRNHNCQEDAEPGNEEQPLRVGFPDTEVDEQEEADESAYAGDPDGGVHRFPQRRHLFQAL